MARQAARGLSVDTNWPIQDVRNRPSAATVLALAIWIGGRRSLISSRRLGQGVSLRLLLELGLFVQMGAHQGIPVEDALVVEFSWAHLASDIGLLNRAHCLRRIGDAWRARIDAA